MPLAPQRWSHLKARKLGGSQGARGNPPRQPWNWACRELGHPERRPPALALACLRLCSRLKPSCLPCPCRLRPSVPFTGRVLGKSLTLEGGFRNLIWCFRDQRCLAQAGDSPHPLECSLAGPPVPGPAPHPCSRTVLPSSRHAHSSTL